MKNRKATAIEIEAFLRLMRRLWNGSVIPRQDGKNDQTLMLLGLTPNQRALEARSLQAIDYMNGPEADRNSESSGEIWKFVKMVNGQNVYIKFKKYMYKGQDRIKCLSFHV